MGNESQAGTERSSHESHGGVTEGGGQSEPKSTRTVDPDEFQRIVANRDSLVREKRTLEKSYAELQARIEQLELEKSEKAEDWGTAKEQLTAQYERRLEHLKTELQQERERVQAFEAEKERQVRTERFGRLADTISKKTGVRTPIIKGLLREAAEAHEGLEIAPEKLDDESISMTVQILKNLDPDSFESTRQGRANPAPGLNLGLKDPRERPAEGGGLVEEMRRRAQAKGGRRSTD